MAHGILKGKRGIITSALYEQSIACMAAALAHREVARIALTATTGQTLWDTRQVPAGVYVVELYNAEQRLGVERLVVQPQD